MPLDRLRRREVIALLGGAAAAWPLAAHAQQSAMPVIGYLSGVSADGDAERVRALRQGLKEAGYVEGENLAIEYRWADNHIDRLPELAADLARRQVAVIVATGGTLPALTAKAATTTIPIVFGVGDDPVRLGLVASLARPGGNATGINFFLGELTAKRLELLRELVPAAARVAVLVNPKNSARAESTTRDAQRAAQAMALQIKIFTASTAGEIHAAFESLARERPDALFVGSDPLFTNRRVQLATLAARHGLPASFASRDNVEAGGLVSYGTNLNDAFRQNGLYAGRILKGEKPADLPVVQSTKFELVINLSTAKALGVDVPPMLLARADEVVE
jgi:putative ABC transport system substrate-binding protein